LKIDEDFLYRFEEGLDTQNLHGSAIPASILGGGEISSVLLIGDDDSVAYKRMPLSSDRASMEEYTASYHEYCRFLKEAGLNLPEDKTVLVEVPGRRIVLYIAQKKLPSERVGNKLIYSLDRGEIERLIERILTEIEKVWSFNKSHSPEIELALDGQLSNWVWPKDGPVYYIDTGTPIYRKNEIEQLNTDMLVNTTPFLLRWIFNTFFLDDVLSRYYDPRQVNIDLVANLFKEQRPDLVPFAVEIINRKRAADVEPLTVEEVEKYYKGDRFIWAFVQAMRRLDCWFTTKILGRRFEVILPEKIKR
jgi:hypothetical protein